MLQKKFHVINRSIAVAQVLLKDVMYKNMTAFMEEPATNFYKLSKKIEHLSRPKKNKFDENAKGH